MAIVSTGLRSLLYRARALGALAALCLGLAACAVPEPPERSLPTLPAVLDITPAPTLDIDATATAYASVVRPSPTPAALYTVQDGDTLSGLAERFSTTVEALIAANGIADPNSLQPGQTLIIPSLLRTPVVGTPAPDVTTSPTVSTP
jgi:LysM repeat protein